MGNGPVPRYHHKVSRELQQQGLDKASKAVTGAGLSSKLWLGTPAFRRGSLPMCTLEEGQQGPVSPTDGT